MKEDKKIEINYTENIPVEMTDKQKELEELMKVTEEDEALWEEIQREEAKISKNYMYVRKNMTYKGEEIPKDVPFTEYFGYIFQNFRNPKPKEEWTDVDYKADYSRWQRLHVASVLGQQLSKQTIPLIDRQKRIIERVRNGTDFDIFSSKKFLEMLS